MKEILIEAHGGPEQLKLHNGLSQAPGPNQVRRISARRFVSSCGRPPRERDFQRQ